MKFIKVGNLAINPALIAFAERREGGLTLHFPLPIPAVVGGISYAQGSAPPAASGHCCLELVGPPADEVWKQLEAL